MGIYSMGYLNKLDKVSNSKKVFLGGTIDSCWREIVIPQLKNVDYFNPKVSKEEWTPEFIQIEYNEKDKCDYLLYTITPSMTGMFAICEATDDSNKRPEKTIVCFLRDEVSLESSKTMQIYGQDFKTEEIFNESVNLEVLSSVQQTLQFSETQWKSIEATADKLIENGAMVFWDLDELINYLNNLEEEM